MTYLFILADLKCPNTACLYRGNAVFSDFQLYFRNHNLIVQKPASSQPTEKESLCHDCFSLFGFNVGDIQRT